MNTIALWITEVTRMSEDRICIAGVDDSCRVYRPIRRDFAWTRAQIERVGIEVGSHAEFLLTCEVNNDDFPHSTENCLVRSSIRRIGGVSREALAVRLARAASPSITQAFGGYARGGNRWVEPGTTGPSLGAIVVARSAVTLCLDAKGRPRLRVPDCAGSLPITDLWLRDRVERAGAGAVSSFLDSRQRLYIRLGLAHPWAPEGSGEPERCWIQVNAITPIP